jgi:hypothetical protein
MSKIVLNKVDEIRTTSGTIIDLENIQASGGASGSSVNDIGITLDTSGVDNIWEVDATPSTTAFSVSKQENNSDGSVDFIFPVN